MNKLTSLQCGIGLNILLPTAVPVVCLSYCRPLSSEYHFDITDSDHTKLVIPHCHTFRGDLQESIPLVTWGHINISFFLFLYTSSKTLNLVIRRHTCQAPRRFITHYGFGPIDVGPHVTPQIYIFFFNKTSLDLY